jgi:hypothetical protein
MELLIMTQTKGENPAYQDGDILLAFNQDRILWTNAQNICGPQNFSPNSVTGYYDNPLLAAYLENTSCHRYVRINTNEVERTNLISGEKDILSAIPNYIGESVEIDAVINKRLKEVNHYIFGSCGKEVWYNKSNRPIDVDAIWRGIEDYSDHKKEDNLNWPFTEAERKLFLPLSCAHLHDNSIVECSKKTAVEKVEPIMDNVLINPSTRETKNKMVKRRRWFVPYWDYSFVDTDAVRDVGKESDYRDLTANDCVTHDVDENCLCKIKEGLHIPSGG